MHVRLVDEAKYNDVEAAGPKFPAVHPPARTDARYGAHMVWRVIGATSRTVHIFLPRFTLRVFERVTIKW